MGYNLPGYDLFHMCQTVPSLEFILKLGCHFQQISMKGQGEECIHGSMRKQGCISIFLVEAVPFNPGTQWLCILTCKPFCVVHTSSLHLLWSFLLSFWCSLQQSGAWSSFHLNFLSRRSPVAPPPPYLFLSKVYSRGQKPSKSIEFFLFSFVHVSMFHILS